MAKRPKRPRDFAQLGKLIVDIATGAMVDEPAPTRRFGWRPRWKPGCPITSGRPRRSRRSPR